MKTEINDLIKIGLSEGEIKLYKALLELGETTRTQLAKKSGISPSKIYDVANRLAEKGLISIVKKQGITHFSAADPTRLKNFLENKNKEIEGQKEIVDCLLPALMSKYTRANDNVDIEIFYGWEGLKSILLKLENSMSKGDESLVFGASIGKNPEQSDIVFNQHQQRIEKRGYKVRIIFNEDIKPRKDRYKYYVHHKLHKIRFLHQTTLTEIYIYKDSVLFVILLEKPISINVKSLEAVDAFRKFFETMWKQATK